MNTSNRKNIAILAFTLIVVMLGYGLVILLYPFYIEKLGASGSELGLLVSTAALLELLFGPVWGGISDRVGRKPILLLGVVGYALSSLLFGLSTEVWMLFASRALSGVLSSAVAATALAYISDSTAVEERGWGMGMLGAALLPESLPAEARQRESKVKTLLRTVIMSLASKRTTLGQGTAMGLCNSFMNLGRVVGPIWAGFAFDMNVAYPDLSGAAVMAIGFVISLIWISQPRTESPRATGDVIRITS